MTEERIIGAGATREDAAIEASIRPQRLDDYLGQQPANITELIDTLREEGELDAAPAEWAEMPLAEFPGDDMPRFFVVCEYLPTETEIAGTHHER